MTCPECKGEGTIALLTSRVPCTHPSHQSGVTTAEANVAHGGENVWMGNAEGTITIVDITKPDGYNHWVPNLGVGNREFSSQWNEFMRKSADAKIAAEHDGSCGDADQSSGITKKGIRRVSYRILQRQGSRSIAG